MYKRQGRELFEYVRERRITALHAGDSEGVLFANQRIRTPLTVGGEVAVFQVAAGEALVASGVAVFEDGEGGARKAVHMHLIRGQPCGGADGIVVSKFHVRQVDVPVVLPFVDDHRQHLSHGVVDALDAIVAIGMVALVGIFRMPRSLYTASDSFCLLYTSPSPRD